LTQEFTYLFTI